MDNLLLVAKRTALEAGTLINKLSSESSNVKEKQSRFNLVTKADLESEKLILSRLQKVFPDHNIVSEERGRIDKGSEYTWVVDPLDGTISFASNIPVFSVSIGLLKNKKPLLGVVYNVAKRQLYFAKTGKGAFLNGQPIHVRKTNDLKTATMGFDFQNFPDMRVKDLKRYSLFLNELRYSYVLGAAVYSSALVAEGRLDGYIHICRPWDFVATAVLVEEAGGKLTDWQGREIDWGKDWVEALFSNGIIHNKLVRILNRT